MKDEICDMMEPPKGDISQANPEVFVKWLRYEMGISGMKDREKFINTLSQNPKFKAIVRMYLSQIETQGADIVIAAAFGHGMVEGWALHEIHQEEKDHESHSVPDGA